MLRSPLLSDLESPRKRRFEHCWVAVLVAFGLAAASVVLLAPAERGSDALRATELGAPQSVPLFRIEAVSPFDAGLQHGRLAQQRIHGWFDTPEMRSIFAFVEGGGRQAFENLKRDNAAEFPAYVEEMRGIAEGANVTMDQVWCANMINELESLMTIAGTPAMHCSDIFAISDGGYESGFAHGHNDDWSEAAKPFWYLTSYHYSGGATPGFRNCAGVTYPATLVGWSPTWNEHGMFATQNTLIPRRSRAGGLACAFVQRRAVCPAENLDDVVRGLATPGWSDGASMNVVDVFGRRMANVELWEDTHSVVEVLERDGNYSHFNEYKHLTKQDGDRIDDARIFARDSRQATVDLLPPPRTAADVADRLSNPSVYRPTATLVTVIVNGSTGELHLWADQPSANNPPLYSWDLRHFFDVASGGVAIEAR